MPKGTYKVLTYQEKSELVETYINHPEFSVKQIAEMFGTSEATVYRLLNKNDSLRKEKILPDPFPGMTDKEIVADLLEKHNAKQEQAGTPSEVLSAHVYHHTPGWPERTVTVDSQDTVQAVTPVPPKVKAEQWMVRYTAEITVEAESIDLALAQVRKLATVRRIYSVRLK